MPAASFGRIDEFQPENESITTYLEHIDLFLAANDVATEKQVPVSLSVIGGRTYTLLHDLLAQAKQGEMSFPG